jgi:enoyl-CoA hydratase/carnithine racemase
MSGHKSAGAATYRCDSGLGIIHLADGRGNRLNGLSLASLSSALEQGLSDESAKVILLRSGEESFCLGMDLDNLEESLSSADRDPGDLTRIREAAVAAYGDLLERITSCPKPVIALVEGDVKAGGVGLAAACDIVIASEAASWELSEVLFGLVPYNVLPFVFGLRMSPQRFRYLVLAAKKISAAQARDFGLADEVYAVDELERKAKTTIRTMMRAEPGALAEAKSFFVSMLDADFSRRREAGGRALVERMNDPAVLAGLEAFSSGATPGWFGRFKPSESISGRRANDA